MNEKDRKTVEMLDFLFEVKEKEEVKEEEAKDLYKKTYTSLGFEETPFLCSDEEEKKLTNAAEIIDGTLWETSKKKIKKMVKDELERQLKNIKVINKEMGKPVYYDYELFSWYNELSKEWKTTDLGPAGTGIKFKYNERWHLFPDGYLCEVDL